jgi:hypothetical protein
VRELRVNFDDMEITGACYEASARSLAGSASAGGGRSFQPSAAAVHAVHTAAATTRAALSARTTATGLRVAEANARYVEDDNESTTKLDAVDPQVV